MGNDEYLPPHGHRHIIRKVLTRKKHFSKKNKKTHFFGHFSRQKIGKSRQCGPKKPKYGIFCDFSKKSKIRKFRKKSKILKIFQMLKIRYYDNLLTYFDHFQCIWNSNNSQMGKMLHICLRHSGNLDKKNKK